MADARKFSGDDVLQIVDQLVKVGELAGGDARAMTELALLLKQMEYDGRAGARVELVPAFRQIRSFCHELASVIATETSTGSSHSADGV